jgi:hypothetical protein
MLAIVIRWGYCWEEDWENEKILKNTKDFCIKITQCNKKTSEYKKRPLCGGAPTPPSTRSYVSRRITTSPVF